METSSRVQEDNSSSNNGGHISHHLSLSSLSTPKHHHLQHHQIQNPPVTRSESNPYPTTFVQADTSSFKQVVQMLTGSSDTVKSKSGNPIPPVKTANGKPKPSKALYERRNSLKNNLRINPLVSGFGSAVAGDILSPSLLDFPALALSPVTPLLPDPFNRSPVIVVDRDAEEKAIAQKGFYLHPSPTSTPRDSEPRLLPLFPVTSPRISSGSNPTSC